MTVSSHYLGQRGEAYAAGRRPHSFSPTLYRMEYRYFRPHLRPTDTILDFGCGRGWLMDIARRDVARAEGLEINEATATVAEARGLKVYRDISELPEGRYDVVISNHVLEHVRDPSGTLERLPRSMKPDGKLVMKLPMADWRDRKERVWRAGNIDHHLHGWTPMLIGNTLEEAGFRVGEIRIVAEAYHRWLFPLARIGLARAAFWGFAVMAHRRQLFVLGHLSPPGVKPSA